MGQMVIGVDPGKTGAIAVLDPGTGRVQVYDLPGTIPAVFTLVDMLPEGRVIMEKLHPGEKLKLTTIAVMFEQVGVLKAAFSWRGLPVEQVRPSVWKPALGVTSVKDTSRAKACELFPADAGQWARVKDHNRAEAALLAQWGIRAAR